MAPEKNNGFFTFIGALAVGIGLLYLSGWFIAWNEFIATKKSFYISHGLAIEFNNRYYGFLFKPRFFDSPFISWCIGLISISVLSTGLNALLAESEGDEEPSKSNE